MRKTQLAHKSGDWWEETGYRTMAETRDEQRAKLACALKLQALADEIQAHVARCKNRIGELGKSTAALASQLYQRHQPISDIKMIALCVAVAFLMVASATAFGASAVGNVLTLLKFGLNLTAGVVIGLAGTALVTLIGERLHAKVLARHPILDIAVVILMAGLTMWALIDFGRGRGMMTQLLSQEKQVESFVDEPVVQQSNETVDLRSGATNEESLRGLFSDALTKLTVVADVAVGLLLGALISLLTEDDFAGWRKLRKEKRQMIRSQHEFDTLVAIVETAKKRCAAGIVRAAHYGGSNHPPYLAAGFVMLLLLVPPHMANAQDNVRITREEIILLDVSGSMAHKAETRNLFNEMLQGIKQLLRTEPPESRTWLLLISTDSFGGVQTLVRGWTPSATGIFVDRLNKARSQLVSNFDQKAEGLTASASGTDIFGAIARARALMDSEPNSNHCVKELYLFTDGVNETGFNMPALIPTGVDNMISLAKTNRLIVPLTGVRVYVFGASTANLNPESWTTIKNFWAAYFKAAGAELVAYSPEGGAYRR